MMIINLLTVIGLIRLYEKISRVGLQFKYNVLASGVEEKYLAPELKKSKLKASNNVFDYILCSRVLCCVESPQEAIEYLYTLLKPGKWKFNIVESVVLI
jgi:hypothetical protein